MSGLPVGQGQMGIRSLVHPPWWPGGIHSSSVHCPAGCGAWLTWYRNHFPSGALEGNLFSMRQSSLLTIFSSLSSILLFSLTYLILIQRTALLALHFYPNIFPTPPHSLPATFLTHSLHCPKGILDQKSQSEHFYFSPGHIPPPRQ